MNLVVSRIHWDAASRTNDSCTQMAGVAVRRIRNPGQVVRRSVIGEIDAVTGLATTATDRHGNGPWRVSSLQ